MVDIVALLQCTRPHVTATTVRQLSRIIVALVAMPGRVTMVGIARWGGQGGSYRTIQRFFATTIPLFAHGLWDSAVNRADFALFQAAICA